MTSTRILED